MKKLIMGLVAALIATTTPAMAYWTAGVSVEDGVCEPITTSFEQDQYWVGFVGYMSNDNLQDHIDYHTVRSNGNNINAAAVCWLEHYNAGVAPEDVATNVEQFYGYQIPEVAALDDYSEELTTAYLNLISDLPSTFPPKAVIDHVVAGNTSYKLKDVLCMWNAADVSPEHDWVMDGNHAEEWIYDHLDYDDMTHGCY